MAPPKKRAPKSKPKFDFGILKASTELVGQAKFTPEKGGTKLFIYTKRRCREFLNYYQEKANRLKVILEDNYPEFEDTSGKKLTLANARRLYHVVQCLSGTYDDDMADNSAIDLVIDMTNPKLRQEIVDLNKLCVKFLKWYLDMGFPNVANYLEGEESE